MTSIRRRRIRRRAILIACSVLVVGVVGLAVAMPGAATCVLMEYRGLDRLPGGELVQAGMSAQDKQASADLHRQAIRTIDEFFGSVKGRPMLVFLSDPGSLWPARFNGTASTLFIGTRACVVVGPEGRSTDVVAHELVHAELFERVGAWHRLLSVPTWFDEGLAMQVDHRERYDLKRSGNVVDTDSVRALDSPKKFFVSNDSELTRHYAFAKAEVAGWLLRVGRPNLAARLQKLKEGEAFEHVWND